MKVLSLTPLRASYLFFCWWLLAVFALTWSPAGWHLEHIAMRLPNLRVVFFVALAALCIGVMAYCRLRRHSLWRYEPAFLTAFTFAACVWFEPGGSFVCLILGLGALLVGSETLKLLSLTPDSALEELILGVALGLGIFGLLFFLLGTLGLLSPLWIAAFLLAPLLLLRRRVGRSLDLFGRLHRAWGAHEELKQSLVGVGTAFLGVMLVFALVVVLSPATIFDTMKLQMPVVKLFAAQQSLQPFPELRYSYYSHGLEILMAAVYGLTGQIAAQMLPFGFFALLLLVVFRLARQCSYGPTAALLAASVAFCVPFLHVATTAGKNDAAVAVYQLAALSTLLKARSTGHLGWTYVAAFLLGCSLSIKYSAALGVLPLALLLFYVARHKPQAVAVGLSVLVLTSGFWPARAAVFTGSPLHPLQLGGFPKQLRRTLTLPDITLAMEPDDDSLSSKSSWDRRRSILTLPWDMHFKGGKYFNTLLRNPLGFSIPLFLPLVVLARRRLRPSEWLILLVSAIAFLPWAAMAGGQFGTLRFVIMPVALWIIFLTGRLASFAAEGPHWMQGLLTGALLYNFAIGFCAAFIVEINQHQFAYFGGSLDQRGYLREVLPAFRALESVEEHIRPGQSIAMVDSCPAAYAPEPWRVHCFMRGFRYDTTSELMEELDGWPLDYILAPSWITISSVAEFPYQAIWRGPKFTAWRRGVSEKIRSVQ